MFLWSVVSRLYMHMTNKNIVIIIWQHLIKRENYTFEHWAVTLMPIPGKTQQESSDKQEYQSCMQKNRDWSD